jgi:hypothetical protein
MVTSYVYWAQLKTETEFSLRNVVCFKNKQQNLTNLENVSRNTVFVFLCVFFFIKGPVCGSNDCNTEGWAELKQNWSRPLLMCTSGRGAPLILTVLQIWEVFNFSFLGFLNTVNVYNIFQILQSYFYAFQGCSTLLKGSGEFPRCSSTVSKSRNIFRFFVRLVRNFHNFEYENFEIFIILRF